MTVEKITATIRTENPQDYPSVYNLNTSAFKRKEEARLVDRLRLNNNFIPELSIVATIDKQIIGYILFTEILIVNGTNKTTSLALAPMSVMPEFQRKGIGAQLIYHGFEEAKKLGFKSVLVLGNSSFYSRFGFTLTSKWAIIPPLNFPEEAFMGIELEKDSLSKAKGHVKYPTEFDLF